jgi:iron complex transport system permease protein
MNQGRAMIVVLSGLCVAAALASLLIGPARLNPAAVLAALAGGGEETVRIIVWELRVPRVILALMIGATLGMAGAALQGFVRNPLASPEILGVPGFAAFGAVVAIYGGVFNTVSLAVPIAAIAAALAASAALIAIAGRDGRLVTLILAGLALSTFAGALTSFVLSIAPNPFAAMEIAFWLLGSLSGRSFEHVAIAAPFMLLSWALMLADRRALLALTLGEDGARALGVSLRAVRIRLALAIASGVGAAVAVAGAIGFIGLVVPHLVRPFAGYDPARILLPSALAGAALLTFADCAARLIPSGSEIKLGVLTALIGVPFFLLLLARARRGQPAFL